jgi:endoglucanase
VGPEPGVPLLVGEFGVLSTADPLSRARWTAWVRGEAERLGLSWAYWDFGTDFGAYDLERETWHGDLLTSLLD